MSVFKGIKALIGKANYFHLFKLPKLPSVFPLLMNSVSECNARIIKKLQSLILDLMVRTAAGFAHISHMHAEKRTSLTKRQINNMLIIPRRKLD